MGECAAAIGDSEKTSLHPLQDLVDDTVSNQVREALDQTLEFFHQNANNHLFPKAICRQINFWCPHQEDGDKYLVVMSRQVSQALVEANLVTTCQLPRFATVTTTDDHADTFLNAVNYNFQLSNRSIQFIARDSELSRHVYAINRPVIFISHETRYNDGSFANNSTTHPASKAIFHCGATLQDLGHASTEMRMALFSIIE